MPQLATMVGKNPSAAAAQPFGRQPITSDVFPVAAMLAIMDATEAADAGIKPTREAGSA